MRRTPRRGDSSARQAAGCPASAAAAGKARRGAFRRPKEWKRKSPGGGQRSASIAISRRASRSQAPSGVEFLLDRSLTFEKLRHLIVRQRVAELRVDLVELSQQIHDLLHTLLDDLANGLAGIESRLLLKESDREARDTAVRPWNS